MKTSKADYAKQVKFKDRYERFVSFYDQYFMGENSDEKVTEFTTQPFYQSMSTKRNRLLQNNLTMSTSLSDVQNYEDMVEVEIGNENAIVDSKSTKLVRRYYKDDRCIYKEKKNEILRINYLNSKVQGNTKCPNCGYEADISSFIDGCDQCGSKFEIKELEPKVSAFTLNQNVQKDAAIITKVAMFLSEAMAVLMLAFIFGGVILSVELQINGGDEIFSGIVVYLGLYMLEPMIRFAFVMALVTFVMGTLFEGKYGVNITNASAVEEVITDFSVQDFYQNLEMRLNQIYLANDIKEVGTIATCGLKDIVESHLDIVDSSMNRLHFLEASKVKDGYLVKCQATMRLYRYCNGKIKRLAEQVTVEVKLSSTKKSIAFINAYKCSKCGSTVDILMGGKCDYCGNQLSLDDVGMQITGVEFEKTRKSFAPIYIRQSIIAFVICFVVNAFVPCVFSGFKIPVVSVYEIMRLPETFNEIYDGVPTIEWVVRDKSRIKDTEIRKTSTARDYTYIVSDARSVYDAYKETMQDAGYRIVGWNATSFEARKAVSLYHADGEVIVTVVFSEDTINVHYYAE